MNLKTLGAAGSVAALALAAGGTAMASAPPVGAIPKGPVSTVTTPHGQLVAVALPRKANGLVWRIARSVNSTVLRQVSEANVGTSVVLVFRTVNPGNARVIFALTRGDTAKAVASFTQVVRVT